MAGGGGGGGGGGIAGGEGVLLLLSFCISKKNDFAKGKVIGDIISVRQSTRTSVNLK